jgi:uncharacterized damage-inducible protein DinB
MIKTNSMIRQALIKEIEHEGAQTKKILERVPVDKFNWKPHEKSREIGALAIHVAQLPSWTSRALSTSEFDMATMKRQTPEIKIADDLVKISEDNIQKAIEDLQKASDEEIMTMWTFKRGGHVIFTLPRAAVIRSMAMNHLIHHRGQLSVYLRLLDIPVPGMYGPSADEM